MAVATYNPPFGLFLVSILFFLLAEMNANAPPNMELFGRTTADAFHHASFLTFSSFSRFELVHRNAIDERWKSMRINFEQTVGSELQ